ncbi:MAG: hypothetical protein EBT95_01675 [Verrucomicrobia bacterium]|nr:hypothetical protein [Verrucomicrobiota bacterium]
MLQMALGQLDKQFLFLQLLHTMALVKLEYLPLEQSLHSMNLVLMEQHHGALVMLLERDKHQEQII